MSPSLTVVTFKGSDTSDARTLRAWTLRRAAELARERGKKWFVLYSSLMNAALDQPTSTPHLERDYVLTALAYVHYLDRARREAFETEEILGAFETESAQ